MPEWLEYFDSAEPTISSLGKSINAFIEIEGRKALYASEATADGERFAARDECLCEARFETHQSC